MSEKLFGVLRSARTPGTLPAGMKAMCSSGS
jgi:hypothetical protein